jgi:hypothetical protein
VILQNGILLGLVLIVYSLLMWLTCLDAEYLNIGQYLDILVIIVPIIFIIRAIRHSLPIHIGNRLLIATGVGLIAYLIHAPYMYVYHNFINPDWFDWVIALEKQKMVAQNIPTEDIQQKIEQMININKINNKVFTMGAFLPSVIIIPAFIALSSLVFIKNKKTSN